MGSLAPSVVQLTDGGKYRIALVYSPPITFSACKHELFAFPTGCVNNPFNPFRSRYVYNFH